MFDETIKQIRKNGLVVSNSEIKTKRSCSRLWKYKYLELRQAHAYAQPLHEGSAVHYGIEQFWKNPLLTENDLVDYIDDYFNAHPASGDSTYDTFSRYRCHAAIIGYYHRWSEDRMCYKVLGVEEVINPTPINDKGDCFTGKLDAEAVDLRDNTYYIIEHKTTGRPVSDPAGDYWMRLKFDNQIRAYKAIRDLERGVSHKILYDVIEMPGDKKATPNARKRKGETAEQLERRKNETPEGFRERLIEQQVNEKNMRYIRRKIVVKDECLKEWHDEAVATIDDMRNCIEKNAFPINDSACWMYNRRCDFYNVCAGLETLNSPNFKVKSSRHTELEEDELGKER